MARRTTHELKRAQERQIISQNEEVPRDGLHASVSSPHVNSPTGSQAVSAHALRAIRVSNGSVPRVAHRPSVPHAGVVSCPASLALFGCSDRPPSRLGPLTRISKSPPTPHFSLT
jgi:hypothetical protein